jgi:hypothetical protein
MFGSHHAFCTLLVARAAWSNPDGTLPSGRPLSSQLDGLKKQEAAGTNAASGPSLAAQTQLPAAICFHFIHVSFAFVVASSGAMEVLGSMAAILGAPCAFG